MNTSSEPAPVLVTGGTGRTGTRIARRLAHRQTPVRIGTRNSTPPLDWHNPTTWGPALDGVRAAYLCYSPDLAFPGVSELMSDFSRAAAGAGVQRLVLLSGRGEDGARAAEDAVRASGLEWTVLRCSWFAQTFSENFLLGPVRRGRLMLPADGGTAEPFLDIDDFAEVAADSLSGGRHMGKVLELTGPRLLTLRESADELSAATGRPIEFVPCTTQEFAADLVPEGIPTEEAMPLAELFSEILDGRNASLTTDLARALSGKPTDFSTYATRAAATGVWTEHAEMSLR